jgi:hypothetical protein
VQAMAVFRYKDADALHGIGKVNSPVHLQAFREWRKSRGDFRARNLKSVQFPFHAHQEQSGLGVNMIVGVNDVAVVLEEKFRDPRHQALLVRATDQQYGSGSRRHGRLGRLRDVAYNKSKDFLRVLARNFSGRAVFISGEEKSGTEWAALRYRSR